MVPKKGHICSTCKSWYSRLEHLQRHYSIAHEITTGFRCEHCSRVFGRRDVLARHYKICRSPNPLPFNNKRGHRRTACQRCARRKRACDGLFPCTNCAKGNVSCDLQSGYETKRTRVESRKASESKQDCVPHRHNVCESIKNSEHSESTDLPMPAKTGITSIQRTLHYDIEPAISFRFLLEYTKTKGLMTSFEGHKLREAIQKLERNSVWLFPQSLHSSKALVDDNDSDPLHTFSSSTSPYQKKVLNIYVIHWENLASRQVVLAGHPLEAHCVEYKENPLETGCASPSDLSVKCCAIIQAIEASNTTLWNEELQSLAHNFFSADRVAGFLESFWFVWSPNWPVIHRPTFQISSCPIELCAAMILVGACHSDDVQDRLEAKLWFDCVEVLVFESFRSLILRQCTKDRQSVTKLLRMLQSAYCVCIYQYWDGSASGSCRARWQNFDWMIAGARLLLAQFTSDNELRDLSFTGFCWSKFVLREEIIRTLAWVFLLDSAFTIFHGVTPKLALRELGFGLVSPESCFHAQSAEECHEAWMAWNNRVPSVRPYQTVYELIIAFCKPILSEDDVNWCAHQGFMNLWIVASAFHVMLFHLELPFGVVEQSSPLRRGLDNWKIVWNRRLAKQEEGYFDILAVSDKLHLSPLYQKDSFPGNACSRDTSWKIAGFWRNAAEWWLLARTMLDRMISWERGNDAAQLLSGANGPNAGISPRILDGCHQENSLLRLHEFLSSVNAVQPYNKFMTGISTT